MYRGKGRGFLMSVVIYMFREGPKKLSAYLGPCPTCVPSLAPVAFVLAEKKIFENAPWNPPPPGVQKLGKSPPKKKFSNFEISATALHKTSLGMIFHTNKNFCEMHGWRVISPQILGQKSKIRFFRDISRTKQFLEKQIEMNPYYFSICDILALEIPL